MLRIQWALLMLPLAIGAIVMDLLILRRNGLQWGFLSVAFVLLALLTIIVTASRQHSRWGYRLGEDDLRVARGYAFHTDTLVPFVRVQHIDVGQGRSSGYAASRIWWCIRQGRITASSLYPA